MRRCTVEGISPLTGVEQRGFLLGSRRKLERSRFLTDAFSFRTVLVREWVQDGDAKRRRRTYLEICSKFGILVPKRLES